MRDSVITTALIQIRDRFGNSIPASLATFSSTGVVKIEGNLAWVREVGVGQLTATAEPITNSVAVTGSLVAGAATSSMSGTLTGTSD